jgi:hypothetical protein
VRIRRVHVGPIRIPSFRLRAREIRGWEQALEFDRTNEDGREELPSSSWAKITGPQLCGIRALARKPICRAKCTTALGSPDQQPMRIVAP